MLSKPKRIVVLVGLAVLAVAAWNVAAGKGYKEKQGRKVVLPPPAAAAIKKAYPKATIAKVEWEKEAVILYEVELREDGKEIEVEVAADGLIVEVERKVTKEELPEAVAKTLGEQAGDAEIKELEKEKIHAVVKLVKLDKPQTVYEAKVMQNGKLVEVKIAEDGKLLGKKVEHEHEKEDDDEEKHEGKHEEKKK